MWKNTSYSMHNHYLCVHCYSVHVPGILIDYKRWNLFVTGSHTYVSISWTSPSPALPDTRPWLICSISPNLSRHFEPLNSFPLDHSLPPQPQLHPNSQWLAFCCFPSLPTPAVTSNPWIPPHRPQPPFPTPPAFTPTPNLYLQLHFHLNPTVFNPQSQPSPPTS